MKHFVASIVLAAILLCGVSVSVAHAVNPLDEACGLSGASGASLCEENTATKGKDRVTGTGGIIPTIFKWVVRLVGIVSIIMIMVGGFRYITSGGDTSAIKGAKETIIYALVGLIVAGFAGAILNFVLDRISV